MAFAADPPLRKEIEDERAGPHRYRDVHQDRVQRMTQPFSFQNTQQPFHGVKLRALISTRRVIQLFAARRDCARQISARPKLRRLVKPAAEAVVEPACGTMAKDR